MVDGFNDDDDLRPKFLQTEWPADTPTPNAILSAKMR